MKTPTLSSMQFDVQRSAHRRGQSSWRWIGCAALVLATLSLGSGRAFGHATGENYVWVNVAENRLEGRFEMRFPDIEQKLNLEMTRDGETPAEAARRVAPQVQTYILAHFRLLANGEEIPVVFQQVDAVDAGELGIFAQFHYVTEEFDVPDQLTIENSLFFENDLLHRSLIAMEFNRKTGEEYGEEFGTMIFSPMNTEQELDLMNVKGLMNLRDFVWQGILHIWIGIDHILFLLALLLPAVLLRRDGKWKPVGGFKGAFINILKIVTLFTVAHSITLTLAALGFVELPSRMVESVIALSIILVAVNTIWGRFQHGTWILIFFFGLFHGLGFASVMAELPFRIPDLTGVVFSFNVGVEIGQVAIVLAAFPLIYLLRNSRIYLPVVLRGGSVAICAVAAYWFVERAFAL